MLETAGDVTLEVTVLVSSVIVAVVVNGASWGKKNNQQTLKHCSCSNDNI